MLLTLAWGIFVVTCLVAVVFGMLYWFGLTRTHLDKNSAAQYVVIYSIGAVLIMTFMLAIPL